MKVIAGVMNGVAVCQDEPRRDERGSFTELFNVYPLNASDIRQVNCSTSSKAGTIRGMHWQEAPHAQAKAVRCIKGSIEDVVVDVRPDSPTYGRTCNWTLKEGDGKSIYIPEGFAHGWQALEPDATIMYVVMKSGWQPSAERGLSPLDPELQIGWPLPPTAVSERDLTWPVFKR